MQELNHANCYGLTNGVLTPEKPAAHCGGRHHGRKPPTFYTTRPTNERPRGTLYGQDRGLSASPAHALGVFQHTDAHAQALGFSGIPDLLENLGQDIELQAAELRLIGP